MPPKKPSKLRKEASRKVHDSRGTGSQSQTTLDFDKLRKAGWMITECESSTSSGVKVYFKYVNPEGKTVKSAIDIQR